MLFFRRQTAGEVLTYFVYAPLLVLVFLGFCRLLFGKSPLCKQKKQCSRRTTKHNFGCAFFFVRLRVCCSRTSCTLRYACSPFAIFNACSAPDYLFVSNTLRASFSSFSAFAVCSLASHLFASKKSSVQDVQPSTTSVVLFSLSGYACVAHVLRVRSAPCPRLPRLVRLAPRLVNVWQEITTPLRMLAFRDFRRLLCARLSLCFKHAPRLVLVFLGSCRLLFGKSPLCKQKSSVQDVQQKHGDLPCFLI